MNKLNFLFSLALLITISAQSQPDSAQYYVSKAREAQERQDTLEYYSMITRASTFHPYHQNILYQSALASAMTGHQEEAIDYLRRAIRIRSDFDLNHPAFQTVRDSPKFSELKDLQAQLAKTVIHSDTAFSIKEKTLHIECIASGESKGVFYFGSIHKRKIIRRDERGKISDFTTSGQDGITSVFGIKVDVKANLLWACASPIEEMEGFDKATKSAVFKYDVNSRKLLKQYVPSEAGIESFIFGDLTLDPRGMPYISDSKNNIIFRINPATDKLENFYSSKEFWNLQGISFSADGKTLFIADYIKGIFKLNMSTRELTKIEDSSLYLSTKSTDGMVFYKNSLIAIQNGVQPMRVTRYWLDKNSSSFSAATLIDNGHPAFNEPTIGCISGTDFYYVANSMWSGYNKDHSLKSEDQLEEVIILKVKLD